MAVTAVAKAVTAFETWRETPGPVRGATVRRLGELLREHKNELGELVSHLHSVMLDRTRPLWTCHVIEGLDGNRFAVYVKMHHALTDGVNGMRLVGGAMATEPGGVCRAAWREPVAAGGSAKKGGKRGYLQKLTLKAWVELPSM